MIPLAKTSVYEVLLASTNVHNPADKATYPHMRTLLEFDTREFLNVLSLAFEEPDFDASIPLPGIPTRQELVDILLKVMVHEEQHTFSPSQVGSLFTFLARQGSKHRESIRVDEHVYDQVLEYITHADEEIINEERQQALIELWHSGVLQKFDEEKLLIMAHGAKFYRLCELLYEKRQQFVKVLSCYLEDAPRRPQAFNFIHSVMTEEQYTEADREEVAKAVIDNFQLLISTNIKETARLIVMDFPLELDELCGKLQNNEEVQYQFLQGIFDPKHLSKQDIQGPYSHVAERYIELLCKFEPDSVCTFLKSYDNYRLEEALDICSKAHIVDATAYLLERTGDIMRAFQLILTELKIELEKNKQQYYQDATPGQDFTQSMEKVQAMLQCLIMFCQRNSGKVEKATKQLMWFSIFELIQGLQHENPVNERLSEMYNKSVSDVLNSMLGYISLQDILLKIMQVSGHFKDIKPYVMKMLDNYNYEETLLKTTNHIMIHDVKALLAHLCSQAQRGISPKATVCSVCSRASNSLVDGIQDHMIVFSCGHLFHSSCIGYDGDDLTGIGASCSICDKTSSTIARSKRRTFEQAQKSDRVKNLTTNECRLSSTQLSNLQRFNQSYRSADSYTGNMELRLAPPSTNGR